MGGEIRAMRIVDSIVLRSFCCVRQEKITSTLINVSDRVSSQSRKHNIYDYLTMSFFKCLLTGYLHLIGSVKQTFVAVITI